MKRFINIILMTVVLALLLTVGVCAASESENNNTKEKATAISVNTNVTGSISTYSDVDWYKFTTTKDGAVTISFTHEIISSTNEYWDIFVYQSDGVTSIDNSSGRWYVEGNKNLTTCELGLKAGTYYIKITAYSSYYWEDSTYTLKVNFKQSSNYEKEINSTSGKATSIKVNTDYFGTISNSSDKDWYKFTTTTDGALSLSFTHTTLSTTDEYWDICVYESDGVTSVDGSGGRWYVEGHKNLTTCELGLKAGTYYIKIAAYSSYYWEDSTYTLKVNFKESSYYEKEINSTSDKATNIAVNTEFFGTISNSNDKDWYKFTTTKDGAVTISFNHTTLSSTNEHWRVFVYQSDGVTSINGSSGQWNVTGNKNLTTCELGLKAGTYYIKIETYSSYYWENTTYTLKVNFKQSSNYEKEINSDSGKATNINLKTDYFGASASYNDADWFVFQVTHKAEISVKFTHPVLDNTNTYWRIYSYKSDGVSTLKDYCNVSGTSNASYSLGELSPGTYYIKVLPYSSSYVSGKTYTIHLTEAHDCVGPWETVTAATCDTAGSRRQVCTICGSIAKTETVPALGHSLGAWTVDRQATCSAEGQRHATCTVCGATKNETIAKKAHTYGEWSVVNAATCDAAGTKQAICTACRGTVEESIPRLTHKLSGWTVETPASCGVEGTEARTCEYCGKKETRSLEPLTHEYGEWKEVSGNKLIPPIVQERRCEICGHARRYEDWSYSWVAIIAAAVALGIVTAVVVCIGARKRRY